MTSAAFTPPVVATYGAADPSAPLVVLLHGRGSDERQIIDLAAHLPSGPAYASRLIAAASCWIRTTGCT